ncbi:MAG: hypothetical protein ACR2N5_06415 [Solirubrobacterales bacterium]
MASLLLLTLSAARSHAATEIGQTGAAGQMLLGCSPGVNFVQIGSTGPTYRVPDEGGVITEWRHEGAVGVETRPQASGVPPFGSARLLVWRQGNAAFTLVDKTDIEEFASGPNAFVTRIPVDGDELLGLRTIAGDTACSSGFHTNADFLGVGFGSDPAIGDVRPLNTITSSDRRLNLAATVEPDKDGDGFGDETQDIELKVKLKGKLPVKRSGFPVKVKCGAECDATIKGKATAKTSGSASAAKKATFKVKSKKVSVGAGKTKKTKVKLKKASAKRLAGLLKQGAKGAKLKLTAKAENSIGSSDKAKAKSKLKG